MDSILKWPIKKAKESNLTDVTTSQGAYQLVASEEDSSRVGRL